MKQYQIEITDGCMYIYIAWENIKENIKSSAKESLGLHELKQHKAWFDEECFGFLDQR